VVLIELHDGIVSFSSTLVQHVTLHTSSASQMVCQGKRARKEFESIISTEKLKNVHENNICVHKLGRPMRWKRGPNSATKLTIEKFTIELGW